MSIACALAEALHHSSGCLGRRVGVAQHGAVRGQTSATRARGPATQYFTFGDDEDVPAPGERLFRPQERGLRRSPAHVEELTLDVPVLQMAEQPTEVDSFFRNSVPAVAEQVIEVPKLALPVCAVQRAALPEPQLVEQLVAVPTVLTYSLLKQRTAEQVVDSPVPLGRGRGARGGLQGSSQGQGSTAVCGADEVVSPTLHARGGGARGGLLGLSPGQGSTAFGGADNVVSPALHAREGRARGGLQGLSQGQGSTAVCGTDHVVSPVPHGRSGGALGGLQGLSQGQGSAAVFGADNVVSLVPHGRGGGARGGLPGLSPRTGLSSGL